MSESPHGPDADDWADGEEGKGKAPADDGLDGGNEANGEEGEEESEAGL